MTQHPSCIRPSITHSASPNPSDNHQEQDGDAAILDGLFGPDLRLIFQAIDWPALFRPLNRNLHLLDIGSEIRHLSRMLESTLNPDLEIRYDRVAFFPDRKDCGSLPSPFRHRSTFDGSWNEVRTRTSSSDRYEIIWAIHSFSILDSRDLSFPIIRQLLHRDRGTALIVLPKQHAFCHQLRLRYRQLFPSTDAHPSILTAEHAFSGMNSLGMPCLVRELECVHAIPLRDEPVLDTYLRRCAGDRRPSQTWRYLPSMRDFLDGFRHGSVYRFPHPIWVILGARPESGTDGRRRLYSYLKPISRQLVA